MNGCRRVHFSYSSWRPDQRDLKPPIVTLDGQGFELVTNLRGRHSMAYLRRRNGESYA
jgi:hypothetical protein